MNKKLTALIYEPNPDRRAKVRECMMNLRFKVDPVPVASLIAAAERCLSMTELDFVAIGSGGGAGFGDSVAKLSESLKGPRPPLLAILSARQQDAVTLTDVSGLGFDAVITEPFSLQSVQLAIEQLIESDAYRTFQKDLQGRSLEMLASFTLALLDERALAVRDERPFPFEQMQDWKKVAAKLRQVGSSIEPELVVDTLLRFAEKSAPFAAKNVGMSKRRGIKPLHPARVVRRLLDMRGISDDKFISAMNLDATKIQDFLGEKQDVDGEIAAQLARVLGHTKEYWLDFIPKK